MADGAAARTPILLTVLDRERTLVARCCESALFAGIAPGMPLAEARALVRPHHHHAPIVEPISPDDDRRDLQRLARWAYRFAPVVAVDGDDGLFLDARGCERLYGGTKGKGIERLARRLVQRLQRAGFVARLAVAPTFGAAWALARYGRGDGNGVAVADNSSRSLAPLPIGALRLSPQSVEALHAVGVTRIDQLCALPRSSLAARYGPEVLLRLDQAFGRAMEAITPVRPAWPMRVEHLFDGPTDRLESITVAVRALVEELASVLATRHRGSLSLGVELLRSDLDSLVLPVRTSEPSADAAHLWKLLAPKLEQAHLGYGVEGVRVVVLRSRRLRDQQATCWRGEGASERPAEVARLIDTLHARLSPDQVLRPVAVESHLPERAFAFAPVLDRPNARTVPPVAVPSDRPTVVRPSPLRIDVSLLVPDGPLMSVRWGGSVRAVRACIGPERLSGEWWRSRGNDALPERDYFKVQTDDGRWLWLYREVRGARWFLHGEWA